MDKKNATVSSASITPNATTNNEFKKFNNLELKNVTSTKKNIGLSSEISKPTLLIRESYAASDDIKSYKEASFVNVKSPRFEAARKELEISMDEVSLK